MNFINLETDKIYRGLYLINDTEYFSYFKYDKNKNITKDIITEEERSLEDYTTIEYIINNTDFKFYNNLYKEKKDKNIFKTKDDELVHYNNCYLNILRFFDLENFEMIYDPNLNESIINQINLKLTNYVKRYIGESNSVIYLKQIKKYNTLAKKLSIIPKELYDKIKPFWMDIMKTYHNYIKHGPFSFLICDINSINKCNLLDLKIEDIYRDGSLLYVKYTEIENKVEENYKNILKNKIKEAKEVLNYELEDAQKSKDNELITEIEILLEEFEKTENNICNINFKQPPLDWWPSLLYPIIIQPEPVEYMYLEDLYTLKVIEI